MDDDDLPVPERQVIDLSRVAGTEDLHVLLMRELRFPDWYGRNWDAFNDAITGLVRLPKELTFRGWTGLAQRLPRDAGMMRDILERLQTRHGSNPNWSVTVHYED